MRVADLPGLDRLQDELDGLVSDVIDGRRSGKLDPDELATYQLALSQARQALDDRWKVLSEPPPLHLIPQEPR